MQDQSEPDERHQKRKRYTEPMPQCVLLLRASCKQYENEIANHFKECGWQIYDHLYPFRLATKHIRHSLDQKEDFTQFLATAVCNDYYSDKTDYVFYSFLKWFEKHPSNPHILVLGIHNESDIETFRRNGSRIGTYACDISSDLLFDDCSYNGVKSASNNMKSNFKFHLQKEYEMQFCKMSNARKRQI